MKTGECSGFVVSNNVTRHALGGEGVQFGATDAGEWVIGHLSKESTAKEMGIVELVTGFGWLVFNGSNIVPSTGGEQAPRTAVGLTKEGGLLMLEVDGCEKCPHGKGPTLRSLADIMLSLGAHHAMNMDGGGSSTFLRDGKVENYPTCFDVPFKCQRRVATAICVTNH